MIVYIYIIIYIYTYYCLHLYFMDVINQLITSYNWVAPPCRVCRKHWILLLSSLRSCKCILATPSLCLLPPITLALRGPIWHDGVLSSLLIWDHWGSRAEWSTRFLMNHVQNTDQWDGLPFATMPHLWYISYWRLLAIVRCEPLGFLVCHSLCTACSRAMCCCPELPLLRHAAPVLHPGGLHAGIPRPGGATFLGRECWTIIEIGGKMHDEWNTLSHHSFWLACM